MLPILGGIFLVGLVLGLLVAALNPSAPLTKESDLNQTEAEIRLPWEVLRHPEAEALRVSNIVQKEEVSTEAKIRELVEISDSLDEPPLARGLASFAAGVALRKAKRRDEAEERFLSPTVASTELSAYALYFVGRDQEGGQALSTLSRLVESHPEFVLIDEARLQLGRLLVSEGAKTEAAYQFRRILKNGRTGSRGEAMFALGEVLSDLGEQPEAARLMETLYYDMPTDPLSRSAERKLASLKKYRPQRTPEASYRLAWARAEKLFEARHFREAYADYSRMVKRFPHQVDEELVLLRRGVCQYQRRQSRSAETTLSRIKKVEYKPEAVFYRGEAARRLRKPKTHRQRAHQVLELDPESRWAEEALWSLARSHVAEDESVVALKYYERLARDFPQGKYVVDARWRVLWMEYKMGRYPQAAAGFVQTAREHPEAGELSRFLYWGGRSYQALGRPDRAIPLYRQVLLGYANTYYGRRAAEHLARLGGEPPSAADMEPESRAVELAEAFRVLRTDRQVLIGHLLTVGLHKEAEREAELAVEGADDDSAFLAILAWLYYEQERYRDAMITMRRAYPFHISATGDLLPTEAWEIIYPLKYWEMIQRHSDEHQVDPYLVLGLIRQESTFNPRVRSPAGARGLMQIMPYTGRRLARDHRRRYQTRDLHDPDISIRYGTHYLKQVMDRYGGRWDYALASYNAGPHRVKAWTAMDLGLDSEEFIEEIPFTETRNYVKLVLRNEMMYRRIYGKALGESTAVAD
jgi:soluble lytic murein transglycosylase